MKSTLLITAILASSALFAQIELPKPSPTGDVEQDIGLTEVDIEYSRPSARGRKIFGELVPYGKLWRTGANKCTQFSNDKIIQFGGKTLPEGEYALFTIPGKEKWTIIISQQNDLWGTGDYKVENDVFRISVPSEKTNHFVETFTINFADLSEKDKATLVLKWANTKVSIPIAAPSDKEIMATITETINDNPSAEDYYSAAVYYLKADLDANKALTWMNKAIEKGLDRFYVLHRKALIQAKLGDYAGAIATAKASKAKAEKAGSEHYTKANMEKIAEWQAKL